MLTQEEIEYIKTIVEKIQLIAIKFDYHDEKVATLCYDIDMSMRAILEIINGPNGLLRNYMEHNQYDNTKYSKLEKG